MADRIITVTDPSVVTNDTLSGYNNYSDIDGQLGTTMTPTEATNGHTVALSDGVVHEVTTKPVGTTNGEFAAVVSNAVTVDLSGVVYNPWEQPDIRLALLSNSALPIDQSLAEDGTGGNPMVTTGSDPTNDGSWNTFTAANSNYTILETPINTLVGTGASFTDITYFIPQDISPSVNQSWYDGSVLISSIQVGTDDLVRVRIAGTDTYELNPTSAYFTVGTPVLVTVSRELTGNIFIQLDDNTPIDLGYPGTIPKIAVHGAKSDGTTPADVKIGRRIAFSSYLTGQDLIDAKEWVLAGDLT